MNFENRCKCCANDVAIEENYLDPRSPVVQAEFDRSQRVSQTLAAIASRLKDLDLNIVLSDENFLSVDIRSLYHSQVSKEEAAGEDHFFHVRANGDGWTPMMTLDEDSIYSVFFDGASRWTLNKNAHPRNRDWEHPNNRIERRHYCETSLASPERDSEGNPYNDLIRIGWPHILVWHHGRGSDGAHIPEIRQLNGNWHRLSIRTGPRGGSIHCHIVDVRRCDKDKCEWKTHHGDNDGSALVIVRKVSP